MDIPSEIQQGMNLFRWFYGVFLSFNFTWGLVLCSEGFLSNPEVNALWIPFNAQPRKELAGLPMQLHHQCLQLPQEQIGGHIRGCQHATGLLYHWGIHKVSPGWLKWCWCDHSKTMKTLIVKPGCYQELLNDALPSAHGSDLKAWELCGSSSPRFPYLLFH